MLTRSRQGPVFMYCIVCRVPSMTDCSRVVRDAALLLLPSLACPFQHSPGWALAAHLLLPVTVTRRSCPAGMAWLPPGHPLPSPRGHRSHETMLPSQALALSSCRPHSQLVQHLRQHTSSVVPQGGSWSAFDRGNSCVELWNCIVAGEARAA